jgi:lipid-A-disaccharide synthase-like uncharacterized protein
MEAVFEFFKSFHWTPWVIIGFLGQALFASRFIVQWISSERAKKVVIPTAFWYMSLSGGLVLLLYAIHKRDPVFTLGQLTGIFVYTRNLMLLHTEKRREIANDE